MRSPRSRPNSQVERNSTNATVTWIGPVGRSRIWLRRKPASAADTASQYPQHADQIIAGAKTGFLNGADWAYTAGLVAIILGAALVYFMFPKHPDELRLLEEYHEHDAARSLSSGGG